MSLLKEAAQNVEQKRNLILEESIQESPKDLPQVEEDLIVLFSCEDCTADTCEGCAGNDACEETDVDPIYEICQGFKEEFIVLDNIEFSNADFLSEIAELHAWFKDILKQTGLRKKYRKVYLDNPLEDLCFFVENLNEDQVKITIDTDALYEFIISTLD
jgi:hypothetical protein